LLERLELTQEQRVDALAGLVAGPEVVAKGFDDVIRRHPEMRGAALEHAEHRGHDATDGAQLLRCGALERGRGREEVAEQLVGAVDQMDVHDPNDTPNSAAGRPPA